MKTVTLTATAKTVHQLDDLHALGLGRGINEHKDGSFSASREFDSKEEAETFLSGKSDTLAIIIDINENCE